MQLIFHLYKTGFFIFWGEGALSFCVFSFCFLLFFFSCKNSVFSHYYKMGGDTDKHIYSSVFHLSWKTLLKQFVLSKILYAYLVILKAVYILVHNRPLCINSSISGEKIHVYKSHKIRTLDIS